jgi:hypothetical protein
VVEAAAAGVVAPGAAQELEAQEQALAAAQELELEQVVAPPPATAGLSVLGQPQARAGVEVPMRMARPPSA